MSEMKKRISESSPAGIKSVRAWGRLLLCIILSAIIMFSQMLGMTVASSMNLPPLFVTAAGELLPLILTVLLIIVLGGKKWLGVDKESLTYAFKAGWPFVALGVVASMMQVFNSFKNGITLADGFVMNIVGVTLTCILIGLFEEYFYRGVNFGALLGVLGGSKGKIMIAVILSAIGFGRAHVVSIDFSNVTMLAQAVLKIIQTGMIGIVMCDVMLHTKKLGAAGLLHAANDFMLMITGALFRGASVSGQYVSSDAGTGSMIIITYLAMIAVYMYPTIRSLKRIWDEHHSCYGPFVQSQVKPEE